MADLFAYLTETFIYKATYKIRWARVGNTSKPAVILTHGTPFSSLEWLPYAKALQVDYCVYFWDLPGFGASQEFATPDEDVNVSYAVHGKAFAALCKHWGSTDDKLPHVIAHDIGGHAGTGFLRLVRDNAEVFESISEHIFKRMLEEYVRSASYKPLTAGKTYGFIRPWLDRGEAGRQRLVRQIKWASPKHTEECEEQLVKLMENDAGSPKKLRIIWGENDT